MADRVPKPKTKRASRPAAEKNDASKTKRAKPVSTGAGDQDASRQIDERIASLGGWRAETLANVRRLIHEADPEVVEECKWRGTPVWSHAGIICTGEAYKSVVKLTFARGASLEDPKKLFNSSLEGNTRRAIDIREGEKLNAAAFKALFRAAVKENLQAKATKSKTKRDPSAAAKRDTNKAQPKTSGDKVVLLSGGNPQIAKADGDAPVQAYIAAMPGWKSGLGRRLDDLVVKHVPNVRKAVRWNSPFYGIEGMGWFLSFHVFTHYVKVTFFNGTSLRPIPPGGTERSKEVRWIDIREHDELDEEQFESWFKQAAALPGWIP